MLLLVSGGAALLVLAALRAGKKSGWGEKGREGAAVLTNRNDLCHGTLCDGLIEAPKAKEFLELDDFSESDFQ